jgi:hypothetical protein
LEQEELEILLLVSGNSGSPFNFFNYYINRWRWRWKKWYYTTRAGLPGGSGGGGASNSGAPSPGGTGGTGNSPPVQVHHKEIHGGNSPDASS